MEPVCRSFRATLTVNRATLIARVSLSAENHNALNLGFGQRPMRCRLLRRSLLNKSLPHCTVLFNLCHRWCSVSSDGTVQPLAPKVFNLKRPRCSTLSPYTGFRAEPLTSADDSKRRCLLRQYRRLSGKLAFCLWVPIGDACQDDISEFGDQIQCLIRQYHFNIISQESQFCFL